MHQYLKSIGFSEYNSYKSIRKLKEEVIKKYSRKQIYSLNEEEYIFSYEKDYGECFGLCVIKIGTSEEDSDIDTFFPYLKGYNYLYNEKFESDPISDREGFYVLCDDNNIGIPLIFFINNPVEFRKLKDHYTDDDTDINCVTLSGLASDGVILLPIEKDEYQRRYEVRENEIRNDMINAAKSGDIEAMEQLTLEDMDIYTCVNRRSKKEDIFTIVSSYFMPYTVECDKYSILADILDVTPMKNKLTGEELYYISMICNSIEFQVMINKKDIMGVPEKGRRFKGHIWMQGQMDCV